ncbi:hypothetical protein P167DRAFT_101120 [Morchella conica CCBAS932]|uniref:Secreted protein n=1 Tax=Morchella conica CCBAS932 TaxID=1392247 RepID=A0A3N4KSE7_9PEZI|nr:hypothetical protein P167DRAFT_101120 [Morchella conica CCBAS932]
MVKRLYVLPSCLPVLLAACCSCSCSCSCSCCVSDRVRVCVCVCVCVCVASGLCMVCWGFKTGFVEKYLEVFFFVYGDFP